MRQPKYITMSSANKQIHEDVLQADFKDHRVL